MKDNKVKEAERGGKKHVSKKQTTKIVEKEKSFEEKKGKDVRPPPTTNDTKTISEKLKALETKSNSGVMVAVVNNNSNNNNKTPKKRVLTADSNWKRLKQTLPPQANKARPEVAEATKTNNKVLSIVSTAAISGGSPAKPMVVALDCEMVGDERRRSMLARVCVLNETGSILYDKFVRPTSKVVDYRTRYSGILPNHLTSSRALSFNEAQQQVVELLRGNIVVGHGLKNDFEALKIDHPSSLIRDTARYHLFKSARGQPRKLKHLTLELLQYAIQEGKKGHDPMIDAKAALDLYLKHRNEWEAMIAKRKKPVITD